MCALSSCSRVRPGVIGSCSWLVRELSFTRESSCGVEAIRPSQVSSSASGEVLVAPSSYITTEKETHTPTNIEIGDFIRFALVGMFVQSAP